MQPYFARFGITGSQWGVLRNLLRAHTGGLSGLRISDLSEKLLIQPPSVTGVVDRLERVGLVERKQDPNDLRATLVGLTTAGRQLVKSVLVGHERKIESVLGGLSSTDQTQLNRLLSRLLDHLEMQSDAPKRTKLESLT